MCWRVRFAYACGCAETTVFACPRAADAALQLVHVSCRPTWTTRLAERCFDCESGVEREACGFGAELLPLSFSSPSPDAVPLDLPGLGQDEAVAAEQEEAFVAGGALEVVAAVMTLPTRSRVVLGELSVNLVPTMGRGGQAERVLDDD